MEKKTVTAKELADIFRREMSARFDARPLPFAEVVIAQLDEPMSGANWQWRGFQRSGAQIADVKYDTAAREIQTSLQKHYMVHWK